MGWGEGEGGLGLGLGVRVTPSMRQPCVPRSCHRNLAFSLKPVDIARGAGRQIECPGMRQANTTGKGPGDEAEARRGHRSWGHEVACMHTGALHLCTGAAGPARCVLVRSSAPSEAGGERQLSECWSIHVAATAPSPSKRQRASPWPRKPLPTTVTRVPPSLGPPYCAPA